MDEKCKDKIIIFGASGLVGRYLFNVFNESENLITGTYNKNKKAGLVYFDILNSSIEDLEIDGAKYAIISSAMVGVDNCFTNLKESKEINVYGIKKLIKELSEKHIIPVFISSVFVFDGNGNYTENDLRNPANEYGRQKMEVEDFITENIKEYLIIRLGRVFGIDKNEGMFAEALDKYKQCMEILCNDYEDFSLTYSEDIARGIKKLLEKNKRGVFHIDSRVHKNRFEFITNFFDNLQIKDAKIKRISIDNLNFLEKRAKNQFMDSSKFISQTDFQFTPLEKCHGLIKENLLKS